MADAAFLAWLPDQPRFGTHLREALGVIPKLKSYGPMPDIAAQSDALGERVRGAIASRDAGGDDVHIFAGTDTAIWQLQSGGTWDDVTRLSGAYTATGSSSRWSFTQYGDSMIATDFVDDVQRFDMSTDADFSDLAGSPPRARYAQAFRGFLFLGNTQTSAMGLAWSGLQDITEWTPGTNQSDEVEFPDGGIVNGLRATDALYIFQEYAIRRAFPVGPPTVMRIDKITDQSGCSIPGSLCNYERIFFFKSTNGFQQFDGVNVTPIGAEQVDAWFDADADSTAFHRMTGAVDPVKKLVTWNYASVNSVDGQPDSQISYNYVTKTWGHSRVACELIFPALTLGVTLEDLDGLFPGGLETVTSSLDDPIWAGGIIRFGAFTQSYEFATFSGDNVEARFEPCAMRLRSGRALVKEARLVIDTESATLDLKMTETEGEDPAAFGVGESLTTAGFYKFHTSGRFAYFRATVPAATIWTHAQAIADIKSRSAGGQ